jgi:kynurenine 3-monooxygenase
VTFSRLPYATAFERGQRQRALLVEATRGLQRLDQVDLDAVDRAVHEQLVPL